MDLNIEIEFVLNMDPKNYLQAELVFLQVRSMISRDSFVNIDLGEFPQEDVVCSSINVIRNGIRNDKQDVVYTKPKNFDLTKTSSILPKICHINNSLMNEERSYIWFGPRQWDSSDPFFGIPIVWSDIVGVGAIIETPEKEWHIDPSEDSHFFHNITSAKIGYFTITSNEDDCIDWEWFESLPVLQDTEYVRYVQHLNF